VNQRTNFLQFHTLLEAAAKRIDVIENVNLAQKGRHQKSGWCRFDSKNIARLCV